MKRPLLLASGLAMTAALLLPACGDSSGSSSGTTAAGPAADVTVEAHDLSFNAKTFTAKSGSVTIAYQEKGQVQHTLLIDGVNGFKLEVDPSKKSAQGAVTLQPGTYTLYCDVPGHRAAGMQATLTVS